MKTNNPFLAGEQGAKGYTYYAFISYKHLDKHWARWVQKHLEHYRLPNRLCRQQKTPRHVSPIFRDETDLVGGKNVRDSLEEKICQSKYLIVICSRHMQTEPKYINYEIETFLAAGNPPSRILPLIVDGEANSRDPAMECLPPALLEMGEDMPLGVTLNPRDRKETVLKLIAAILELDLQSLRAHNHDRQQRRIVTALGCGLAFSLGLGAFMTWEMLSVKQAGLREQLTYAEDTFRQGDKLSTQRSAEAVAEEYLPLMDEEISAEAEKLLLMSAIQPKYQPLTRLRSVTADSRLMFDASGQHVMIISKNAVNKYNTQGSEVFSFDISQIAQRLAFDASQIALQIVDVSVDGVHAVVMTISADGTDETRLLLWDMEKNEQVCELVSSSYHEQGDVKTGQVADVVSARFSSDGRTLCAWRDGSSGYFNESEELAAWDAATGEKLFSFSPELLGGWNRPREVKAFEFIGSTTLHWTGEGNHVYYTLGDPEPTVISVRAMPSARTARYIHSIGAKRYTLSDMDAIVVTDLATGRTLEIPKDGLTARWMDYDAHYLFIWLTDERDVVQRMTFVDLHTMQETACAADFNALCQGKQISFTHHLANSPYVYITLDDASVHRLDMTSGDSVLIDIACARELSLIGTTGTVDVLVAETNHRVCVVEVGQEDLRTCTIDEDYDRFISSAVISDRYMAAEHNGSYYLYSMSHPGVQLDAGMAFDGAAVYAASADGALIVKGGGTSLAAWRQGELILQTQLPSEILLTGAADKCFFALTGKALFLYDADGKPLKSCDAPEGKVFCSAKITADGKRIALMERRDTDWADYSCQLRLLDGASLEEIATVSEDAYVIPVGVYETAYDLSPDGRWLSAVVRVWEPNGTMLDELFVKDHPYGYQLSIFVWSTADGQLHVQTSNHSPEGPVFDPGDDAKSDSAMEWLQYVHFGRNGLLLCGQQYGTWMFDVAARKAAGYIRDNVNCDGMPDMLSSGKLLYPARGLHVWDAASGKMEAALTHTVPVTALEAMADAANQNRIYISPDQQWLTIASTEDTWLYDTDDWESGMVLASQRAQVLHLDNALLVYATDDGLWQLDLRQ